METIIRQEKPSDHNAVFQLIKTAFQNEEFTDHSEHHLVDRLRKADGYIPELSLVAIIDEQIVGHILMTPIKIKGEQNSWTSLALAPVSVLPDYRKKGIGGQLIKAAHKQSIELGYKSVVLIGHEHYYPKFGYLQAHNFGIKFPFEAPKENCMAIELVENGLANIKGIVEYPEAFFGTEN